MTDMTDKDWWRGAVIYQIYPRSFQDSGGDGIGDLNGIIQRLEHVAELGADAVWLSPFFRSPMLDFGYDISDYRDVDPMFGTVPEFKALVARAHELGVKIIIDLVLSHTAESHPWFTESRASRDNPRKDWYVWADPRPDGTPPNNWLSIFGGSAWEWEPARMQYYLHNFLAEQPDLNFHCEEVQDELLDVARFWLDMGVDGFRLDTVNFYFCDKLLRDNPPLAPEERNDNTAPAVNPYNFQDHIYSKTQPENIAFLQRLRAVMEEYPAVTSVGEVGESQRGTQVQAEYTSGGDKLHMCYDFDFLATAFPDGSRVAQVMDKIDRIVTEGWACWAFSNHDVVRHATRWSLDEPGRRLLAALLMSLRGSVCLYQGEELGLTEADLTFEDLRDPYGIRFWPEFKGRDGCRTPIPWESEATHGGFTTGTPWLPMAPTHLDRAVNRQRENPDSTLAFYQRMIAFRKSYKALTKGVQRPVSSTRDTIAFLREGEGGTTVFCAFNLSAETQRVALPEGSWQPAEGTPYDTVARDGTVELPAWQAHFAIMAA